mmetsp:Transcript_19718/g.29037  ORF Transcript_19718/g.29037 Transcript_19718/m.29037 type:complete len:655 (+) Transcript_19718:132-2096(+)
MTLSMSRSNCKAIRTTCRIYTIWSMLSISSLVQCYVLPSSTTWVRPIRPRKAQTSSTPTGISSSNPVRRDKKQLFGKMWDRLDISNAPRQSKGHEDYHQWYILNCIAGTEIEALSQCKSICADLIHIGLVDKFVVPTKSVAKSRGNKRIIEEQSMYSGYVFAKLHLCEETYERLTGLDSIRSWMGTLRKNGFKSKPSIPAPMMEEEVAQFHGLLEADEEDFGAGVDKNGEKKPTREERCAQLLDAFANVEIGGMCKVVNGIFKNEDGIVKRFKDGKVCVRMYTYGSQFDEWLDPTDIRKLTDKEVKQGIQGPERPIDQEAFNESMGLPPPRWAKGKQDRDMRKNLMGSLKGSGGRVEGTRNRREDRMARGERGNSYKSKEEEEFLRESRNYKSYKDRQNQQRRPQSDVRPTTPSKEESALSDEEDWSSFVSSDSGSEDDFFNDLLSELSGDLDTDTAADSNNDSNNKKETTFDSLVDDLSDTLDTVLEDTATRATKVINTKAAAPSASMEDDFFATLEQEMTGAANAPLEDGSNNAPKTPSEDDFFANLEQEINGAADAPLEEGTDDTFFASEDDFFANLEKEITGAADDEVADVAENNVNVKAHKAKATSSKTDGGAEDFSKLTVPLLKDKLRERGLKVSGRKAELIERLQAS